MSSATQLSLNADYVTLQDINVRYAMFGIHVGTANGLVLNGNSFESVSQGILFGGENAIIENNYVDKVGGASTWEVGNNAYMTAWLNHDLYIEGSNLTIRDNFFGRSASGLGIQALGVDNSVWDANITYDDSAGDFLLSGNNNHITRDISIMSTSGGISFYSSGNTGNVIAHSYIEASTPFQQNTGGDIGGFSIEDDTINTTVPTPYGYSLDFRGPQFDTSDTFMDGNTWIGQENWSMVYGTPAEWCLFTNHQSFVNWLSQTAGVTWEENSKVVDQTGSFNFAALNAEMDSSPDWTGAPDVIRAYVAATVTAAGAADVLGLPQAVSHSYEFQPGTPLSITASQGLLVGDTAWGGESLTASLWSAPANGQVTMNADGSFTYTPAAGFSGTDSFVYQIEDQDGNTATATVTLLDPPPPVGGFLVKAVEGADSGWQTVATFTDPLNVAASAYGASIAWGDGTTSAATITSSDGLYTVQGDHTYTAAGTETLTVSITGPDGATSTATSTATIAAAPLMATGVNVASTEGQLFNGMVANFTDGNPLSTPADFTATITWGDGSTSAGAITLSGGVFAIQGSHTYAEAGSQPVNVSIADVDGAASTTTSTATIAAAPLTATGVNVATSEGQPFSGMVATFTDGNPLSTPADFMAAITWGDGSTSAGAITLSGGVFAIQGSHTYAEAGSQAVSVSIAGVDGASTVATSTATIAAASLTATA